MSEKEAPEQTNRNNTEKPRQLGGNSNKSHRSHKKLWIIILCLVVLIAAGWAGWWYFSSNVVRSGSNNTGLAENDKPGKSEGPALNSEQTSDYEHYGSLVKAGKYDEAKKYIDTMPISDGAKKTLRDTLEQVSAGYNEKLAKIKSNETAGVMTAGQAASAAGIYVSRDDTKKAVEYYKKAIALYKKEPQTDYIKEQTVWLQRKVDSYEK